ncbi:cytoplasmic dynein 2 heavy chain 1 [Ischnura elegans]|uniref:cytoplasmic dynein 2 heavy chain 1 n=1 Tax=Ischnura elegans TaxID=197161 RepID=UPI001ED87FCC|nr:cytoplasmic dynein 2 heavy chain 1 [Ischnura elegans]
MAAIGRDERKNYILTTAGNYFRLTFPSESLEACENNTDLNNFLDDGSCFSLCITIDEKNNKKNLVLSNQAINLEKKCNALVFFKLKPVVITGDNIHETVFISSMFDSPISTLYHTIQKVFAPSVLKDDNWGQSFDPKLQQIISQLEQNLKRVIMKQNPQISQPVEILNLPAIITIEDELQFWSAVAKATDLKEEKLKAQSFMNILKLVDKDVRSLESVSLIDGERIIDDVQNYLDDLWKLEDMYYPQPRMEHLMEIIGTEVTLCVQTKFKQRNLWSDSFMEMEELMNQAISVCDKWIEGCQNLTTLFWPNYKFHPWRGGSFTPTFLVKLKTRLQEILQVRTMHRQLVRLLSSNEQENLRTKDAFLPFSGLNPVQFNPYTDPLWQVAKKRFEDVLAPAEAKVASKLKSQLNNLAPSSPLQLFQEFKRYLGAIERPAIARALLPLRENLLAALMDYITNVEAELRRSESQSSGAQLALPHMPQIVSNIYWARQLEAKVVDVESTSSKILTDLKGYKDLLAKASEVLKELREYSQNLFDEWVRDITYEMQQKTLSLRTDEPVVTFEENNQFMHVQYNKRLVGLIREVRQLSLLGYRIPPEIKAISEKAKKFSNQAKALEQVANFHNTIGDRMIPSQRPMMLKAALELSQLVRGEGNAMEKVTWSDTAAVSNYLNQLKSAVDRLSKENNRLAAYHLEIQEKAIALMSTDLLHQQHKWKEAISEVRSTMNHVENLGFTNMKSWRIHWDRQFYKVLEYQYQIGLSALNDHLPEIKVDLVFRQQKLQFQPPIEEIRTRYYGQIKRFISIPSTFRGVGGEENLFSVMIERNAHCFGKVFEKAEILLSKLESVKGKFSHWVALGTVDVDRLVRENLLTWQDWDMNFKASKAWEQQIAKLPCNEERIECFCVNVLPVRADIEVHNRRFWDLLASSLQAAILHDAARVEQFANGAIEVLQHSSPSLKLEDVNMASARHAQILKEAPEEASTSTQSDVDYSGLNDGYENLSSDEFCLVEEHSPSQFDTINSTPSQCQVQPEVESDSNRSSIFDTVLCECTSSTSGDALLMCLALGLRHNLTWVALVDITQLEDQLTNDKFIRMLNYRFERQKESDNALEDIYDGAGYRKYSAPGEILSFPLNFSYTFNTDGIPMGKSSKRSIWPIYVQINELPPKERSKHMLLAGIWVGNKDPNMSIFLKPFVEEANVLATEGVNWTLKGEAVNSKVIPLCVSVDSVARSRILNMSQFNGYYGCTLCYHKGEFTRKGMRYPLSSTRYPDRTHEDIVQGMVVAFGKRDEKNYRKRLVKGVKGPTPLMLLKHIDLCVSFPPDYMHSVLLGVVRKHVDLLVSSVGRKYYIGGEDKIAVIDNCLQSIHPPHSITRTPRGLKDMSLWKASEWRSFIVFYCIVCLDGVLKNKYIAHLGMLSTALYLLLQKSVRPEDVVIANDLIMKYIFLFQEFFGKEQMVYNTHLLTHLAKGVLNWGPLWTVNTFPFEGQNRFLLQLQRSPNQVACEIVRKFITFNAFPKLCEKYLPSESVLEFSEEMIDKRLKFLINVGETVLVGRGTPHALSTEDLECLASNSLYLQNCKIYHKFIYSGIRFSTAEYAKGLKTNDSFIFAQSKYLNILKTISSEDESGERVVVFVREVIIDTAPLLRAEHIEIMHVKRIVGYGRLQMHALLLETEKKNKTLASWTKERVDRVRHVATLWDSVQSLLDNYEVIISKQLDTLKACLVGQAENLAGEVKRFALKWEQVRPREESLVNLGATDSSQKPLQNTLNLLREKRDEWNSLMETVEKLNSDCKSMGMEAVDIPECSEVENDLKKFESMWSLFDEFNTGLQKLGEEEWIVFRSRSYKFEEFLLYWCDKLDLPEGGATSLTVRIYQEIESHKDLIPLLKYIRGETFSESHWHELLKLLGIPEKPVESIIFGDFLNARLAIVEHVEALKELNARSASEIVIRQALNELDIWDVEAKFSLTEHKDSQGKIVYIVTDYKDILNKVGDHQCLLQSVKNSANFEGFSDRVSIWESRLSDLDDYLHQLTIIQRKWLYLEPIFGSGVLASEGARFSRIDSDFRWVAKELAQEGFGGSRGSRVSTLCRIPGLRQVLTSLVDQLARCQRSLNEFLEEKRSCFPRFYFLGDEDLLEILGQSMKHKVIQAHLKKLFAGIHSVVFDESGNHIVAMKSQEGEIVQLKNHVKVSGQIEEWLSGLLAEMKTTLKNLMKECVLHCGDLHDNILDPLRYPSQIHCIAEYIVFCQRCERSIMDGSLPSLASSLKAKIDAYTKLKFNPSGNNSATTSLFNIKVKALVLDVIYFLEIVGELINSGTTLLSQWSWQKQLRFYSRKDGSVHAKMVDAEFEYTFEYQGNSSKLVQTPLTHKCFLTLTQAMQMGLGGNPYGPAGTGKTETVKALGSLFGRQVLVFNCDQGIDVKSMERIFVGLVKCGAWGCFDEFNRLKEATMSSVSSQIQLIQTSLRGERASVKLMGQEVHLDHNCGIFVTLNPAGKGYGDRRQLPNNLKQLFRPVVMSQPDSNQIAEVVLQTEGFKNARVIGRKLVEVFSLASSVLSHQHHYDWGLRALKTVLHGCGSDLKNLGAINHGIIENTTRILSEENVAIRSIRLHTLSKLTSADCSRFDSIVADVFGTKNLENHGSEGFQEDVVSQAIRKCFPLLGLVENDKQVRKCMEVYEQLKQRMGVVIVGPPRSGKSTILRLLKAALVESGRVVKMHVLSPKAMPKTHLLGSIDPDTREWSDGILTLTAQHIYAESSDVWSWLVLDGDVDPEWIESLNSVLDDNRLLTLPSGWRIRFGPNVNFLFETHDLSQASPATVSRMGVILLSDDDICIKDIVKSWLNKNDVDRMRLLPRYIEDYFYKAIEWVTNSGELAVGRSLQGVSLVTSGLSHLEMNMNSKAHFAIAMVHGLGANLSFASREAFAKQVFEWIGETPLAPVDYSTLSIHCFFNPERDCIDLHHTERWDAGKRLPSPGNILSSGSSTPSALTTTLPLVLTADIKGALDQVMPWLKSEKRDPFIIVGPAGCGKSTLLKYCFNQLRSTEVAVIHCSAQITPQHVLQKLSHVCMAISNPSGRVYRPRSTESLILYFKDLHMVKPDNWGTSMLIAFLEQVISCNGFHDKNLEWIGLDRIQIVATMSLNSTESQRISLSHRFMSLVHIYSMKYPDHEQLTAIYTTCLFDVFEDWLPNHPYLKSSGKLSLIVETVMRIYQEVKNTFSTVEHNHYVFSPVDITRWCLALKRYHLMEKDFTSSMDPILEVLIFEASCIFRDKLVAKDDREKYDGIIAGVLKEYWSNPNLLNNLKGIYYITAGQTLNSHSGHKSRVLSDGLQLEKINSNDWLEFIKKAISQYERENHPLDLLLIPELMEGVAKAERVLSIPGGSLILAGRCGFGRKSAVKLVATCLGSRLFFPGSGLRRFSKDLKQTMQLAGIEGEQVYVILEDYHLEDLVALDMVNSLLSCGEVPGLYTAEEFESIVSPLKELANNDDYPGSVSSYFTERVRSNLHVILIMDITDPGFVRKLDNNPALVRQCSMQWLDAWSEISMASIPRMMCERSADEMKGKLNELEGKVPWELFGAMHSSAPRGLSTPWRFLSLIKTFLHIFVFKKETMSSRQERLKVGVAKLTEARSVVDGLKAKAAAQKTILSEKQEKAGEALQAIADTMRGANVHKGEMEALQEKMIKENKVLVERKAAIDNELSEVEPLVREAAKAVGEIKSEALSEIRSLRAPPDVVRDILEGVLRLMGIQDTSWNSMKTFLAKRGVKEEIRAFDARTVLRDNREAVEELLRERAESFNPKVAKRASVAAAPLAAWVRANVRFAHVLEKIRPLEKEQAVLSKNLKFAEHQLSNLASGLADVEGNVQKLQAQLSTFSREVAETEVRLGEAQNTLKAAEGLVSQLEDEYQRWKEQVKELSQELDDLPMKALLGAAFVTYLLPSSEECRMRFFNDWEGLVMEWRSQQGLSPISFDLCSFLSSERELLQWQSEGLPADKLSSENAVAILKTPLCALLIDPGFVARDWLIKHMQEKTVEIASQEMDRFGTTLEMAVRFGKVLIVEDVETIHPMLIPILRRNFIYQGTRRVVLIEDKLVDFNANFCIFLITHNDSPKILPCLGSVISYVNFTTTETGLSGQLLNGVLQHEKPELDARRIQLLREEEQWNVKLEKLQDNLLQELTAAQGDILQNKELLHSLNETKVSSSAVTESLLASSSLHAELKKEYDMYCPLADFGSRLYFATSELGRLNSLYQFSTSALMSLMNKVLADNEDKEDVLAKDLQNKLIGHAYYYISRSLFKADRPMFALHLAQKMFPHFFEDNEWEFFTSQKVVDVKSEMAKVKLSLPEWVEENRLYNLCQLKAVLPNLFAKLNLNKDTMKPNLDLFEMEKNENRREVSKLTPFQKVLVAQTLMPDQLYTAITQFSQHALGLSDLSPPPVSLRRLLREALPTEPILFVVSPGADPSEELRALAHDVVGEGHYHEVALGQQGSVGWSALAERLREAYGLDEWVCLKNLHLATESLPFLERELRSLYSSEKKTVNFRLWLITEPHPEFSLTLARSSLKVTFESPPGIKKNVLRTLTTWGSNFLCPGRGGSGVLRARALFTLAWFHAVVQERRNFIPQGWYKHYEFGDSDLRAASFILDGMFSKEVEIELENIHGLCGTAIYGGHIDNIYDFRVLISYLQEYFEHNMLMGRGQKKLLGHNLDLPFKEDYREFVELVLRLPDNDDPSLFGLPKNVECSWQRTASLKIIDKLKGLIHSSKTEIEYDKEKLRAQMTPILTMWKKLIQSNLKIFSSKAVAKAESSEIASDPIRDFFHVEYAQGVTLVQEVHRCLTSISKVVRGVTMADSETMLIADSLMRQQIPSSWLAQWDGPKDPSLYLQGLLLRTAIVQKLNKDLEFSSLSGSIDLSNLLRPGGFLSALKQKSAREYGTTVDTLVLVSAWVENPTGYTSSAKLPVKVTGLQIEGAVLNDQGLVPCNEDSPSVSLAPDCYIAWVPETARSSSEESIFLPIYQNERREVVVTNVSIPCNGGDQPRWIQSGVALFLHS